ncbi:NAD(+) synthase [Coraliomargarita algicola]|uniref:Glutamine-dependent NAD(+) synthetase n=1 Tax=Coraliomargarita algicola TaxID=3092156 RepID=A0ABZ0RER6_9BACT|nr:NAD(+) synthase [Coraliomargarita sp. J2-16]WPJ93993.1 NAD(+) synthase [Coraliomargarita sp. J2-16]
MRKHIHIGAAALNTTPKDWSGNTDMILAVIDEAKRRGLGLLCLPELVTTGYGCEDEFHAPYVSEWAMRILLEKIIPATREIAVTVGLPIRSHGATYNAIAVVVNAELLGFAVKQNLAGDGIHYEPRFFKAWPSGHVEHYDFDGGRCLIGDLVFEIDGLRVGFEICEDAWVAGRPGVELAQRAVDVILNPSASHFSFGKSRIRERFVQEGSRAFHCVYVYANLIGNEAGRAIYDGDCLIATQGAIVARTEPFQFQDYLLIDAVVDVEANRVNRNRQASYRPTFDSVERLSVSEWQVWTEAAFTKAVPMRTAYTQNEEFYRAVTLGLFDYMRKARTNGFAISLSGGADSAACLALVYLMAKTVLQENPQHPYVRQLLGDADTTTEALMRRICVCAYQGTINSSDTTEDAARVLAEETGAQFVSINVQALVDEYETILSGYLGRPLNWETDDISRQNIQARCRAPGIWAMANASNYLLLSTSNRSEAAVGYCTMDGDTAGSLSPVAGIDKTFLRQWLVWAEREHLPSLQIVNGLNPTAELRPLSADQTDEEDLMPYPILNRIQKLAVVQKKSPRAIFDCLQDEVEGASAEQTFAWLKRYFSLWSRNQWKRERYAPSFHVDDENLDPRSWCRYPILSGGYIDELAELEAFVFTLKGN